jgi:hypothetical protein
MRIPPCFIRALDRISCLVGRHRYIPAYEVRQWHQSNGRYMHKEFRYECACCQRPTRWLRWRRLDAFNARYRPDWRHGRSQLT